MIRRELGQRLPARQEVRFDGACRCQPDADNRIPLTLVGLFARFELLLRGLDATVRRGDGLLVPGYLHPRGLRLLAPCLRAGDRGLEGSSIGPGRDLDVEIVLTLAQ